MDEYMKLLKEISADSISIAGGKASSLGELISFGVLVPDGYVVLADSFEFFLENSGLSGQIEHILSEIDASSITSVEKSSQTIQKLIYETTIPIEIEVQVVAAFKNLNVPFVAVRSSASAEDSSESAWAGQLDTFLNVTEYNLLESIRACWASLFTPRAITYRFEKGMERQAIAVAVVVQEMIQSEKSGVVFSVHPVTENRNQLVIEAGFGLGEAVVSGTITPDSYVVEKDPLSIVDVTVNEQSEGLFLKESGGNEWHELGELGETQVLTEEEIFQLAKLVVKIEQDYGCPQDIEWAYVDEMLYITQSRPITTLSVK